MKRQLGSRVFARKNRNNIVVILFATLLIVTFQNCVPVGIKSNLNLAGGTNLSSETPVNPPTSGGSVLGPSAPPNSPITSLDFTIKEVARVGANGFPVTVVVPLPYGIYQNVTYFRLLDANGTTVPAQFSVLNRWWGKDNSVRHVLINFQPVVGAYDGSTQSGLAKYTLKTDGNNITPPLPVVVTDNGSNFLVNTGVTSFTIGKSPFSIKTPKGNLTAKFVGKDPSDIQNSFSRTDVNVVVEENGPLRTIIRASAPTIYTNQTLHTHGWAVRLYFYAGKSFVKMDYQLQNASLSKVYSMPLFFKSLELQLAAGGSPAAQAIQANALTSDPSTLPMGVFQVNGVTVAIKNFWQMFPNGLSNDTSGNLNVELWPKWSSQFYTDMTGVTPYKFTPTNLYWLDDMQATYKEVLFDFAVNPVADINALAKTFQYPPVPVIPTGWYQQTRATLDLGGYIPISVRAPVTEQRLPVYEAARFDTTKPSTFSFGWNTFGIDSSRKTSTNATGGVPYYNADFIATENPADYYNAINASMGELNVRPQWLPGYKYTSNWAQFQLSSNPYGSRGWRKFLGNPEYKFDAPNAYPVGTSQNATPRDDQHSWFYHVEVGYYYDGNPWVHDWYEFIAEFRKTFLNNKDPFPDTSSRARGHSLNHALAAYRVTGDPALLPAIRNFLQTYFLPSLTTLGINVSDRDNATGVVRESSFQMGYLSRALINFSEEVGNTPDPLVMGILDNFIKWNLNNSHWGYYMDARNPATQGVSGGTGSVLMDPQIWYAWKTGNALALSDTIDYMKVGVPANVGAQPYCDYWPIVKINLNYFNPGGQCGNWQGGFVGRFTQTALGF